MIKVYHSPFSRSMRVVWLLEELEIPYEVEKAPMEPPTPTPFAQKTPSGKYPTLEDGDTTIFESGAIVEYLVEKYGDGRLAPSLGSPQRGLYLQWIHFAESTAFGGLQNIAWHRLFKQDEESLPEAMEDYRRWAIAALDVLERQLADRQYLLGNEFSAADVMLGYSLGVAKGFGVLGEGHPAVTAYLDRLAQRPALQRAMQV